MLVLLLSLTVQRPALAALDPSDAGAVTVREWAAMLLCTFGDDEETRADQDCLVEAYRRGWLSLSGVLAPDAALCRGALYESAFAAGDLPVYDWSLYPGGAPLSDYENCLRIGAELGLCPSDADPSQITLEWWERFCFGMLDLAKRCGWAETRSGTVPQNHSGAATEVFRMSHSHT